MYETSQLTFGRKLILLAEINYSRERGLIRITSAIERGRASEENSRTDRHIFLIRRPYK
jgi:hypothetical protein